MISFDLMFTGNRVNMMRNFFRKRPAQRVFIKTDLFFRIRKRCQQAGGGKTLYIDDLVILCTADLFDQPEQVAQLVLFLIPDEDLVQVRMIGQQRLVAFTEQEVYLRIGEISMELLDNACRQHNISYKRRLYDQEFFHVAKVLFRGE